MGAPEGAMLLIAESTTHRAFRGSHRTLPPPGSCCADFVAVRLLCCGKRSLMFVHSHWLIVGHPLGERLATDTFVLRVLD